MSLDKFNSEQVAGKIGIKLAERIHIIQESNFVQFKQQLLKLKEISPQTKVI